MPFGFGGGRKLNYVSIFIGRVKARPKTKTRLSLMLHY